MKSHVAKWVALHPHQSSSLYLSSPRRALRCTAPRTRRAATRAGGGRRVSGRVRRRLRPPTAQGRRRRRWRAQGCVTVVDSARPTPGRRWLRRRPLRCVAVRVPSAPTAHSDAGRRRLQGSGGRRTLRRRLRCGHRSHRLCHGGARYGRDMRGVHAAPRSCSLRRGCSRRSEHASPPRRR